MRLKNEQWIETDDSQSTGPEGAGQAGDTQDLPDTSGEAEESVRDLVETGQDFQAELVEGMEDAAAHPEAPATTHEDRRSDVRDVDRI